MVNIEDCVTNAGSSVINGVGGVGVVSMFVWFFVVNVGCRCVRIYVLCLVFARSTVLNFVCA